MLFTSIYLISFTLVLLGPASEVPSVSLVSTRLLVGFGWILVECYQCLRGFGPGDYHFHLAEVSTLLEVHLY